MKYKHRFVKHERNLKRTPRGDVDTYYYIIMPTKWTKFSKYIFIDFTIMKCEHFNKFSSLV